MIQSSKVPARTSVCVNMAQAGACANLAAIKFDIGNILKYCMSRKYLQEF